MATSKAKRGIPGISFVQAQGGIEEYRLDKNGLRILLVPDEASPVAGCMVTYHVGSRNEAIGYTGATHLLEHLMFKGSEKFNPEHGTALDMLLEERGAMINATTWLDRTNYYEVVPREALPLAIEIEADRMRTARIVEADRQSEMPVVRNEFERGENLPMEALDKELWAAAFLAHPYHHSTIGWRSDIEGVSIERLKQFYDDFYWPDNATLTLAGGFDTAKALNLIKREFGRHPKAPRPIPPMYTEEPKQEGQRRVVVKRSGAHMVGIAHKIPHALHPDMPALLMLSHILMSDKTSRLYRAFIDTARATEVVVAANEFHDPSLFQTYVTLAPKMTHEKAEALVLAEYRKVVEEGVTAIELARAKRAVRGAVAERRDGTYALLSSLNEEIAHGDWTRFVTLPKALEAVTRADIKRVAKAYFVEDRSVVGYFVATNL
ncbi:MAG TPA: pitrilysin family protein [Candidatus Paceibacterota bacterium]|nr:pitrilysin family protein [Candidatus Paceibacterota bacterium]